MSLITTADAITSPTNKKIPFFAFQGPKLFNVQVFCANFFLCVPDTPCYKKITTI